MIKHVVVTLFYVSLSQLVFAEKHDTIWKVTQATAEQHYETILSCSKVPSAGEFQDCWLSIQHQGKNIENAHVRITGGMPQHNHGLPTAPAIQWSEEKKRYNIKGLKFSMLGKWVLHFSIKPKVLKKDHSTLRFEIK